MSDLLKLAKPFPDRYVKSPPRGKYGSYVPHHTIAQALLATVGPYDLSVKEVIRGSSGQIEGCIVALTVFIDGTHFTVEEAGDCENPGNWNTDGARLKDAVSDGVKRCAMRIGLGLHLWAQEDYFLYESLSKKEASDGTEEAPQTQGPRATDDLPSGPDTTPLATEAGTDPESEGPSPEQLQEVTPPAPGSGGAGSEGKDPAPPSAELLAKRMRLKALAKGRKLDLDEYLKPVGKSFSELDETDVDTLIEELKVAS